MTRPPSIRYMGFRCTNEGREYTLRVDGAGDPRVFTVTIPHTAFNSRQTRFQDAPDLCFAKLQRELAANAELPDGLHLVLTTPRSTTTATPRCSARPTARPGRSGPGPDLCPSPPSASTPSSCAACASSASRARPPSRSRPSRPRWQGRDVLACAATGSGKTAAFGLPILHRLMDKPRRTTRALVLTPTRELAAQIDAHLSELAVHTPVTSAAVFGGVGMGPQEHALRAGVDVIVATPGRLLDHFRHPYAALKGLEILVLDEADRMLDMGFLPDIKRVLQPPAGEAADAASSRPPCRRRSSRSRARCCATR